VNYLLIESHPYEGSFNAGAAKLIKDTAIQKGHTVNSINLIDDRFNPVMYANDLLLWSRGQFADPLVKKYQDEIAKADVLVFPFPIWWGTMPAVLKGFCDKVLLHGWAYEYGEQGELVGMLTDKKAIVITTMQTSSSVFETYFNNPVDGGFIKDTLQTCGIEVIKYLQIDNIVSGGRNNAEIKMKEIEGLIS
jgi:putative NADPH-quinone reductase